MSSPSARPRLALLVFVLGLSAACSEGLPTLGERPVVVGQLDRSMTFVEVGTTLAIDIEVSEADGSAPVFRWIWDTPESEQYLLDTTAERGHLAVRFTPKVPGRILLTGRLELDRADGEKELVGIVLGEVRAFGGVPSHPLPAHSKMQLIVGESRSTFAFPIAEALGAAEYRSLGAGPVLYSSDNDGVATVSERGRVTAISTGSARLSMQYGQESASIVVEVREGKLGDPPLANFPIDADFAPILRRAMTIQSVEGRMATNARGWPVIALVVDALAEGEASLGGQVLLAEWTGSGFGLELVSRPYDLADDALVAIDEGDASYLLYSSRLVRSSALHAQDSPDERSYVLAEQTGSDDSWQQHDLAHGQDEDPMRNRAGPFGHARSLRARSGGGVWAVYTSSGTRDLSGQDLRCVDQLLLAQLRGSQLNMHQVAEREVAFDAESGCPLLEATNASATDMMLDILPREGDAALPGIVSSHGWNLDCQASDYACALPVNRFTPTASGYTRKNVLLDFDYAAASDGNRFSYLHLSALRNPDSPTQPGAILIGLEATEVTSDISRTILVTDEGATWFENAASVFTFGFRQDGYVYVGDPSVESMRVIGPGERGAHDAREEATPLGVPSHGAEALGTIAGWVVTRSRLYLAQSTDNGLILRSTELATGSLTEP